MKTVYSDGRIGKARRQIAVPTNVQKEDVEDKGRLADLLRKLSQRVAELEANRQPNTVDMETDVSNLGSTVTLRHNLGGPVRYWPVLWTKTAAGGYPSTGPILVMDETSDDDNLVLKSYVAGRVVLRIESSNNGITFNA